MAFKDILLTLTSYPDPTPVAVVEEAVSIAASLGAHLAAVSCEVHVQVPGQLPVGLDCQYFRHHCGRSRKEPQERQGPARGIRRRRGKGRRSSRDAIVEKCPTFDVPDMLVDYARLRDLTIVPVPEILRPMVCGAGNIRIGPADPDPARDPSRAAVRTRDRRRLPGISAAPRPGRFPMRFRCSSAPRRCASLPSATKRLRHQAFRRRAGKEPGAPRHRRGAGQGRRGRQADRRGSRSLHRFAQDRRPRDGRLRARAMARVHPGRRHQEPAVQAAAADPVFALTSCFGCGARRGDRMAEDTNRDNSRPLLKVRRVSLDTGRENVVVISRHSNALRPDVFRGFSRVELRLARRSCSQRC